MTYEKNIAKVEGEVEEVMSGERAPRFTYAGYRASGGRIDEANYERVMREAETWVPDKHAVDQTKITADISGISLDTIMAEAGVDPLSIYGILRNDEKPNGAEHHHSQMSDQELFVEALRMLECNDAVSAITVTHPHIGFA